MLHRGKTRDANCKATLYVLYWHYIAWHSVSTVRIALLYGWRLLYGRWKQGWEHLITWLFCHFVLAVISGNCQERFSSVAVNDLTVSYWRDAWHFKPHRRALSGCRSRFFLNVTILPKPSFFALFSPLSCSSFNFPPFDSQSRVFLCAPRVAPLVERYPCTYRGTGASFRWPPPNTDNLPSPSSCSDWAELRPPLTTANVFIDC